MNRQGLLTQNITSLLLSLAVALVIWVAAANNDLERVRFPIPPASGLPIELRNVPEGLVITSGSDQRVYVDLLIHQQRLRDLTSDDLVAYADLAGLEAGRKQVEVIVEAQPLAPSFRLTDKTPDRISLQLDEEVTLELPVEVQLTDIGTIAQNYQVLTPTVEPPTFTVTGPRTLLDSVQRAVVEVELDGARAPVSLTTRPQLIGRDGEIATDGLFLATEQVEVTVPIEQKPGYRELIVRTVITGTSELAERGYWIRALEPEPVLIAVVGQQSMVEELNGIVETEPVDVSNLEEGVVIREVALQLPEGISPVNDDFVTVTVRVEPQTSSKTVSLQPTVVGLSPGLRVPAGEIVPTTIDVLLRGPIRELEELNLDQISATLDLSGKGVGAHLIRPRISAPGSLRAESVIPEQVEVTIEEALESREFQLLVQARGLPAQRYAVFSPRYLTATVTGPALRIAEFTEEQLRALVPAVQLSDEPATVTPTLSVSDPFTITQLSPNVVTGQLVSADEVFAITANVQVAALPPELVAALTTEVAIVRVAGPGSVAALEANPNFSVILDVAGLAEGTHALRPAVRLPPGYLLVNIIPERIQLQLAPAPE